MTVEERVEYLVNKYDINHIYARTVLLEKALKKFDEDQILKTIKNKPKPFVKWVGGKRQLLKQFREKGLYPPKEFNPITNTYYEPFVGGGAVFFDLLPKRAVLSDLNHELVSTYNVIKNDVEGLIKKLTSKKYLHDKEIFLGIRAERVEDLNDIEIAARFIYLNRTAFNGMYRVNSSGYFNVPFGSYENPVICHEENLRKVSDALQKVVIKNGDYKNVVKSAKKGDFVYFDPPYYPISKTASFTSYTKESFLEKEQVELRDTFWDLHNKGCFVMLSNSNTKFINDIYTELVNKDSKIKLSKIGATRMINSNASGRGEVKEVLITNY